MVRSRSGRDLKASSAKPMAQKQKRVLFVDDDLSLLEIFRQLMTHYAGNAWEVLTAPEVSKALGILQEGRVDLLVFDLHMPVVDGVQFLKLLQRRFPDLLKVVLTGAPSEETRAACLNHGAELYLEKPTDQGGWQAIHAMLHELARFQPEVGFRGVLRQVGLPDVLQMECLARHSVVLRIRAAAVEGDVFVRDGQIIHAQCQGQAGEEAFNQLLAQPGGEFELRPFTEPPARTIGGSWEFLLMEAARQVDEKAEQSAASATGAAAPSPDTFPNTQGAELSLDSLPDMFKLPATTAPGTPALVAAELLLLTPVEISVSAAREDERPPRVDEVLICSPQGDVIYEWQCPDASGRINFLEFLSQKSRQFSPALGFGAFDRLEVLGPQVKVVAQLQADCGVFVRTSKAAPAGKANELPTPGMALP